MENARKVSRVSFLFRTPGLVVLTRRRFRSNDNGHLDSLAYASLRRGETRSCGMAQKKHQRDNVSQSDIIPALQGALAIYTTFSIRLC